jgi:hypothetical protein
LSLNLTRVFEQGFHEEYLQETAIEVIAIHHTQAWTPLPTSAIMQRLYAEVCFFSNKTYAEIKWKALVVLPG